MAAKKRKPAKAKKPKKVKVTRAPTPTPPGPTPPTSPPPVSAKRGRGRPPKLPRLVEAVVPAPPTPNQGDVPPSPNSPVPREVPQNDQDALQNDDEAPKNEPLTPLIIPEEETVNGMPHAGTLICNYLPVSCDDIDIQEFQDPNRFESFVKTVYRDSEANLENLLMLKSSFADQLIIMKHNNLLVKSVESQKSLVETATLRLAEKEIEVDTLRKKLRETEDSFKIEWKQATEDRLKQSLTDSIERQKYYFENDVEGRLERQKVEYEAAIAKIDKDRQNLSKMHDRIMNDKNNVEASFNRKIAQLEEKYKRIESSFKKRISKLRSDLKAEQKTVALLLKQQKASGLSLEKMGLTSIDVKKYENLPDTLSDEEQDSWIEIRPSKLTSGAPETCPPVDGAIETCRPVDGAIETCPPDETAIAIETCPPDETAIAIETCLLDEVAIETCLPKKVAIETCPPDDIRTTLENDLDLSEDEEDQEEEICGNNDVQNVQIEVVEVESIKDSDDFTTEHYEFAPFPPEVLAPLQQENELFNDPKYTQIGQFNFTRRTSSTIKLKTPLPLKSQTEQPSEPELALLSPKKNDSSASSPPDARSIKAKLKQDCHKIVAVNAFGNLCEKKKLELFQAEQSAGKARISRSVAQKVKTGIETNSALTTATSLIRTNGNRNENIANIFNRENASCSLKPPSPTITNTRRFKLSSRLRNTRKRALPQPPVKKAPVVEPKKPKKTEAPVASQSQVVRQSTPLASQYQVQAPSTPATFPMTGQLQSAQPPMAMPDPNALMMSCMYMFQQMMANMNSCSNSPAGPGVATPMQMGFPQMQMPQLPPYFPMGVPTPTPVPSVPSTTPIVTKSSNSKKRSRIESEDSTTTDEEEGGEVGEKIEGGRSQEETFDSPLSPLRPDASEGEPAPNANSNEEEWKAARKEQELTNQARKCIDDLLQEGEDRISSDWECVFNKVAAILQGLPEKNITIALYYEAKVQGACKEKSAMFNHAISKRGASIICILMNMQKMPLFQNIPNLLLDYFFNEIIPNRNVKFENVDQLTQLGSFFGLLVEKFKVANACKDIFFKSLYWRPPDAIPLIRGMLITNSNDYNKFDCSDKIVFGLRERVAMYCFTHLPERYRISDGNYNGAISFIYKALKCNVPKWTLQEVFANVTEEILGMEVETTLQFATDILAFLCVFFGGESFPHFREQLVNVTKAWHEGKITDGVYAAVIRSIGQMSQNSIERLSAEQLQPLRKFMDSLLSSDSPVVKEALDGALFKVNMAAKNYTHHQKIVFPVLNRKSFPGPNKARGPNKAGGGSGRKKVLKKKQSKNNKRRRVPVEN